MPPKAPNQAVQPTAILLFSAAHIDAVIRVYDAAGNVIETALVLVRLAFFLYFIHAGGFWLFRGLSGYLV